MCFPSYLRKVPQIESAFDIVDVIGRGTFGITYLGIIRASQIQCALKFLMPTTSSNNILSEMKALLKLGKHPNVIELLSYVRYLDQTVLIFPYFPHEKFKHLLCFTLEDKKVYMQQLLSSLAYIHACGIIHRDVNPSNYLYNRQLKKGKLIDFGLADIVSNPPTQQSNKPSGFYTKRCFHQANSVCDNCLSKREKKVTRCGTPGYRALEVLLQYRYQTSAIDIWSCGVILLSLLSKKYPFFTSRHDSGALTEII